MKGVYGRRERPKEKHEDKVQEFVVKLDRLVFATQCTEQQGNDELNVYAN